MPLPLPTGEHPWENFDTRTLCSWGTWVTQDCSSTANFLSPMDIHRSCYDQYWLHNLQGLVQNETDWIPCEKVIN